MKKVLGMVKYELNTCKFHVTRFEWRWFTFEQGFSLCELKDIVTIDIYI